MPYEEIYEALMEEATLLDQHRLELIEKRGFNQETIKRERFGSGGQHLLAFEAAMIQKVKDGQIKESDLVASGVFIQDGKSARLNPILTSATNKVGKKEVANILIPYKTANGRIHHVRPHRLGFTGISIETFQDMYLAASPEEIILTEGEFKAVAAVQYGFAALAIPGISSFSEKEWPRLLKKINDNGVKRIIIMFDNETKNDPNLPGYKDNPFDRYDTEFYAYYMAQKLEKEGKEVRIATLPDGWKNEQGKIDIDGASAALKSTSEMKKVIYDALPRNEYLKELEHEAKQTVLRKMNQKYHRTKVKREFNKYIVTRHRGKNSFEEPISNFVMKVIATHETPDGVKRELEFVNEFGRRSGSFTISPKDMSSTEAFRSFALSRGDFIWRGSIEDLLTIWESEFLMMDEGRYILESDHLGRVEREKIWLFGNVAVTDEGKEIRPDQNGIFWLAKRGVKPVALATSSGRHLGAEGIPYLYLTPGLDMKVVREKMTDTIGKNETSVLLGWVTAVAFMEEIFEQYRSFPFLFITGRWQSGKSTIAEWATNFFGIENAGKSISQTTPVAIQRSLSYYSCLPVYLDEYRNTRDVIYKNGFLRNVYNRQSAGKGVKDSDYGLRDAKVRGTLLLAGEETPKDGAIQSRCIIVFVSKQKRVKNHFEWFMRNRTKFSHHFFDVLKNKKTLIKTFMNELYDWKEFFTKEGIDDRMALNYATVVAGHTIVFGSDDTEFAKWLTHETKSVQLEYNEEQAVSVFLEDLLALKNRKYVDESYWEMHDKKIYFYFHGLHQVWAEQFRKIRGEEAFKEASIRAYLKEEPGFRESNVYRRIKGQLKKCMVFDAKDAPRELRALTEPDGGMQHELQEVD